MSVPHFRSGVTERDLYADQGRRVATDQFERNETAQPGGGGLPWFGGNNSPTYPTGQGGYVNNGAPEPYQGDVGPQNQTGGGGAAGGLFGGMTMAQIIQALGAAGMLGTAALSGNGSGSGSGSASGNPLLDEELRKALAMQSGRLQASEPLYDAILKMAGGLMPTQYQPRWPAATPPPGGGGGTGGGGQPPPEDPSAPRY